MGDITRGVHITFQISFNIRLSGVRVICIFILSVGDGTIDNSCVASERVAIGSFFIYFQIFIYRSIIISSNDSLLMLEVVDLLIKSKIESISSVCDLHALSDDISIIDVKID